jgi:beta-lactamase class A
MIARHNSATPRRALSNLVRGRSRRARLRRTALCLVGVATLLGLVVVWVVGSSPANRPPSDGSGAVTTTVAPSTSTTSTAAPTPNPFGTTAQSYLAGRQGTVSAAAYDLDTGQTWNVGAGSPQDEASVVKVAILEALLAHSGTQGLSPSDESLAQRMIKLSDNDAATALWGQDGSASGIGSFDASAGLTETTPSACVQCPGFPWPGWGLTTTTPPDQITLLKLLVEPNSRLTSNERQYALNLMENVTSSENWGVSSGVLSGVTVALKNGWLPLDTTDTDWQVNSVGWVSGDGRNYLLAILTTGDPSEQYGIDTIETLSSIVWSDLG